MTNTEILDDLEEIADDLLTLKHDLEKEYGKDYVIETLKYMSSVMKADIDRLKENL